MRKPVLHAKKNMLTLYHCQKARSFRPLWVMEELGVPYELKLLPFPPRVKAKDYLGINPLGTVPALLDGSTMMTESAAICEYLVRHYGPTSMAVEPHEVEYGAYLNWLHFGEATLTFPQTLVLRYGELEPPERRQPQVVKDYRRWFLGRLRAVHRALASRSYLLGDRFTAADVSVGYALRLAEEVGIKEALDGVVEDYWERLSTRGAYKRAVEAETKATFCEAGS